MTKKIIGTSAPLFCLKSRAPGLVDETHGTTATAAVFLDWLKRSGQGAWQLLPLSETHLEPGSKTVRVASPYKGYGIGIDPKWLSKTDATKVPTERELHAFMTTESAWIEDYILFSALRDRFGTDEWTSWEHPIRLREPEALRAWREELETEMREHAIGQWRCHHAFMSLRESARHAGILIIGDLPFYVPLQSPIVWAHAERFRLETDGSMRFVSGSGTEKEHFGRQVWGHPLYDWAVEQGVLELWKLRIGYFSRFYDMIRLDHAKGFFHYGSMHRGDPSLDTLEEGPGRRALEAVIIQARKTGLEIHAEDAGDRLEELREALHENDVPGIRILRFAYNEKRKVIESDHAGVANYPENSLTLTSTHDTIPLRAYAEALNPDERAHVAAHIGIEPTDDLELFTMRLIEAGIHSPSRISLVQMQDWLMSKERTNVPGTETPTADPNWRYRMEVPIEDLPTAFL